MTVAIVGASANRAKFGNKGDVLSKPMSKFVGCAGGGPGPLCRVGQPLQGRQPTRPASRRDATLAGAAAGVPGQRDRPGRSGGLAPRSGADPPYEKIG